MRNGVGSKLLFGFTVVSVFVSIYMAFLYAPTERTMGDIQRIFYFHVPSAWIAFLAFFVTCFGSVMFLAGRDMKWDRLAASSAEIGLLFTTLALITGTIWARPVWGVWWTWDARLTSTLVLWLIYVSYLMLRSYIDHDIKRGYLSAVVGIIGFLDVPIVFFSIRWWRTQHPQPILEGGGLTPEMLAALLTAVFAFTLLYALLLQRKLQVEWAKGEVDYLYKMLDQKNQE